MPLTAPIEPGAVSPVDGASLLGRGLTDGPGAARSIAGAELATLIGGAGALRAVRQIVVVGATFDYTPTAGTTYVMIEAQGSGGGGAASDAANAAGAASGGGSGGYVRAFMAVADLGTLPVAIAIGAGGGAGQPDPGTIPGGDGGVTTVGSIIEIAGATGGGIAAAGSVDGGEGGVVTTAPATSLQYAGVRGGAGVLYSAGEGGAELAIGGAGGGSAFAGGAPGGVSVSSIVSMAGRPGAIGCGGGGGAALDTEAVAGGAGGQAVVVIWEFGG